LSVLLTEKKSMPSITLLYPSALWLERECYDMMGIFFSGHRDLRRILTDYGFRGAPLRKDFPLFGFTEVLFDNKATSVRLKRQQEDQGIRFRPYDEKWSLDSTIEAALKLVDNNRKKNNKL
jgi:NADH-quinone oxidoreductase subunit C